VAVGDFNADGKLDLATANNNSDNVSILLGNGTGGFGPAANFGVGLAPYTVAVGDFNADGKLDLATANYFSGDVSILLGDGMGGFDAPANISADDGPASVAVGDFNADGKLDLAVANFDSDNISILLGDGTGGFGAATNFGVGDGPISVAVGDFNGDVKLDFATANLNSNNVSILLGNGTGGFGPAANFGVGLTPYTVAVGDFNADNKLDLATANYDSAGVSILLDNGMGGLEAANFGVGVGPASVAVGDFNADGKLDLATADSAANTYSVLLNSCAPLTPYNLPNGQPPPGYAGTGYNVGNIAYDFTAHDQFGNQVSLYQFYGRYTVLSYCTEWCGPCNFSVPLVDQIVKSLSADGYPVMNLEILLENNDFHPSTQFTAERWVSRFKLISPVLHENGEAHATSERWMQLYNYDAILGYPNGAFPTYVILSPSLKVLGLRAGTGPGTPSTGDANLPLGDWLKNIISADAPNFYLRGTGPDNNPPTLSLNTAAPTATSAKFRDSVSVNFKGGNPWKEIGAWSAAPALTAGTLNTLSNLHAWVGLKNSDDQGTRFDLRAEVYRNGLLVAAGERYCIDGVTRNANLAKEVTVAFAPFAPLTFNGSSDQVSVKILTRIGTNGTGASCGGHSNATGLRLYFDATTRMSRFGGIF
jgi:thiol-disulfide isomerase/thioredoxin